MNEVDFLERITVNQKNFGRLVNLSAQKQAVLCVHALEQNGDELQSSAIVTAEPDRIRIRPPEKRDT